MRVIGIGLLVLTVAGCTGDELNKSRTHRSKRSRVSPFCLSDQLSAQLRSSARRRAA
jgi:hypothetical protein